MEKVAIDLNTLEEVKQPASEASEKPENKGSTTTETEEEESEEEAESSESEEKTPEKSEEKESEGESEEKESEEESSEKTEEKEEKKDEESDEQLNKLLQGKYGEDFKGTEDIDALIDYTEELETKIQTLEAKQKELETAKPKFASEAQEKVFEFLTKSGYDPSRLSDGLAAHAELVAMDVDKTDDKLILEKAYVIRHPELTIDEAKRKFNREYVRKYDVSKDKFENDADYEDAKEDARIDLKSEVAKDRKFLREQQEQFKAKPAENKEEKPKENEAVKKSVAEHSKKLDTFLSKAGQLVFSPTDKSEDDFNYKLNDSQLKAIGNALKSWAHNPTSYNEKGEIIGGFDVDKQFQAAAFAMYGTEIMSHVYKHTKEIVTAERVENLGKTKPNRTGKVSGESPRKPVGNADSTDQWDEMAKKKKKGVSFSRKG